MLSGHPGECLEDGCRGSLKYLFAVLQLMPFQDRIPQLEQLVNSIESSGKHDAAQMLQMAVLKLKSADFCRNSLTDNPLGSIPDRTYAEGCIYFLKAALDLCSGEH